MKLFHLPLLASSLAFASSAAPATAAGGTPSAPASPPISSWLCDDGSGTTLADSAGLYDGLLEGGMGSANWSAATPFAYSGNRALTFDGDDDRVKLSLGGLATGRFQVTVSAWFWWHDDGSAKEFAIWGERDECQYNVFGVTVERRSGVPHGLAFSMFERTLPGACGLGSWHRASSTGLPSSDAWHHVAAVLDPLAGMKLYLDGLLVGTDTNTYPYIGNEGRTTLGDVHTTIYDGYWNGALDEIALFDYALTAEEVAWLFEHSLTEIAQPTAYCTAGTTTNGCTASVSASGSPSASSPSGFWISCSTVEGQRAGLIFYGLSGPKSAAWAPGSSSYLCVQPPVQRTPSSNSGGTSGACDGALALDFLDYLATHPTALGQPLAAGTVCHAQAWFRDPSAPGTTNLSNGLHWTMHP